MIVVAVPVKDLVNAKQRLMPVLTPEERRALAATMLRDVLAALTAASLDAVWVITRDGEVEDIARAFGAEIVGETENQGHTAAVAFAQKRAVERGVRMFITVPGDVPCVVPREVRALITAIGDDTRAVTFVPSRSGLGTNGVALVPPDAMPLRFGEPSFDNHLASARRIGLAPRVLGLIGLGLDIDDADDLRALLAEGPETESGRLLRRLGLADRLAAATRS